MQQISLESQSGWVAKLTVIVGDEIQADFLKQPGVSIREGDVEIEMFELLTLPTESANGWVRVRIGVRVFPAFEEALMAGRRVAQALLAFAVTHKISLSFEETGDGEVVEVIDAQQSIRMEGRGQMRATWPVDRAKFSDLFAEQWRLSTQQMTDSERTSLGFYASADMEVSIEARFILLMTALEAFCSQRLHPDDIKEALNSAAECLNGALGADHPLAASLSGQVKGLIRESVTQSIKRTLKPIISAEQLAFVLKAYQFRSKLLHEGASIPNIAQVSSCLKDLLRVVYSKRFGWKLRYPPYLELPC